MGSRIAKYVPRGALLGIFVGMIIWNVFRPPVDRFVLSLIGCGVGALVGLIVSLVGAKKK